MSIFASNLGGLWRLCIGLEIHAQLKVTSKLFSGSQVSSSLNNSPNQFVSLFDAAFPGTLPHVNYSCVKQAILASYSLGCKVNSTSRFDRKQYYYSDLPAGYQITQYFSPIAQDGAMDVLVRSRNPLGVDSAKNRMPRKKRVRIIQVQLEMDSGKSIHDFHPDLSVIDLNRAGCPLIEIVFSPDIRSPDEATSCIRQLQVQLRHLNICNGDMESGELRCDLNVSVSPIDSCPVMDQLFCEDDSIDNGIRLLVPKNNSEKAWGWFDSLELQSISSSQRVELKNLSSLKKIYSGATTEAIRQIKLLESGEIVERETRSVRQSLETYRLRTKEKNVDYRIFPDPDLPPIVLSDDQLLEARRGLTELPVTAAERICLKYDLPISDCITLVSMPGGLVFFNDVCKIVSETGLDEMRICKLSANWITNNITDFMKLNELESIQDTFIQPSHLVSLLVMIENGDVSSTLMKKIFVSQVFNTKGLLSVNQLVDVCEWRQVSDEGQIRRVCEEVLMDELFKKELLKLKAGKSSMLNFFLGEVGRRMNNKVNVSLAKSILISEVKRITT